MADFQQFSNIFLKFKRANTTIFLRTFDVFILLMLIV